MANCLPFNAIMVDEEYDRVYKAEDWAWYFATFIANGVFPKPSDGLQVIAYDKMEIKVNAGYAFINGYAFRNPESQSITLSMAEGAHNRIDRVIIRWDLTQRDIYLAVLKGVPSAKPVAETLTRNREIWELAIADIYVAKGVTKIQAKDIKDLRFNSALCGIVKGTIEEIDASVLTKQFDDFFNTYSKEVLERYGIYIQDMEAYLSSLETSGDSQLKDIVDAMKDFETLSEKDFLDWFNSIKELLEDATNGEMLAEILRLMKNLYSMANQADIDRILNETYVDIEDTDGLFEVATTSDIDDIIGGTYVEQEEDDNLLEDINVETIVEGAFKEV